MVSLTDFFFGSSGQPGRTEDITPEVFRRLRSPVADTLSGLIESGGGPEFSGPFTAALRPDEEQLLSMIRGQARPSATADAARGVMDRTLRGDFLSPDSNPFLSATIEAAQRPVVQQFEDVTIPQLRSQFTTAGQRIQGEGSSPFARAGALATRGLAQELGDISTRISSENFQAERGRQAEAAAAAPAFDRAQLDQAVRGLETAALPRMIEQMGIDRGMEEFRRRRDSLMAALQAAAGISSPQPVTFQPTEGQPGLLHGLASGFGTGLSELV